jgi:hypothetical protein
MSEQRADVAMDDVAQRVHRELRDTVDQICRSGGGVVFEEFPGALQDTPPPGAPAHHALLAAADALAEALAKLDATTPRRHSL